MIGHMRDGSDKPQGAENITRVDLAVMSLLSLLFGLAVIAKGLFVGG